MGLITVLKSSFTAIIKNWGVFALAAAIMLFFMWSAKSEELDIANDEIYDLNLQLITERAVNEKLISDKVVIEASLQKALDEIESDECGLKPVPDYLLLKQNEIMSALE